MMGEECPEITGNHQEQAKRRLRLLVLLAGLLGLAGLIGLANGASTLSLNEILSTLLGKGELAGVIVWQLRLPRILMAMLVGWGLGVSGVVTQAILRNPLASPYTLGMASAAGFGAVLGIVWGGGVSRWLIAASAFGCCLLTSFLILAVSRLKSGGTETLILAGVAIMFLFSSLTSLVQYLGTMEEVHETVFWFFGSLAKASWPEIGIASLMIVPPLVILVRRSWDLNLMMAGDEAAQSMGVDAGRLRTEGIVLASLMTGAAICFTGVIGFIGLVAPHITRMLIGSDHRYLLPGAGLVGALLVVTADTLARTLWAPQVIPIGIMTSFLGVPFFVYLLLKRSKEYW
jgi:iron complex transport system permease protein